MSDHRPEPFTTVQGFNDLGIQGSFDKDGWFQVAQTKRSTIAALNMLKAKGCERVSLLLNVITGYEPGDYVPVCCYADPSDLARAYGGLNYEKLDRKPTLYFKLDTYAGKPSAFVNN